MQPDTESNIALIDRTEQNRAPRAPFGRFLLIMLIFAGGWGAALTWLLGVLTWWQSALIAITFVTLIGGASWTAYTLRRLSGGRRGV